MKNNKAFTLIELLVVILIIGILAAIAVPQYQIAIEKSIMQEAIINLRAIAQANDRFFLVNGRYANAYEMDKLDISIPGTLPYINSVNHNTNAILTKNFEYRPDGDNGKPSSPIPNGFKAIAQRVPHTKRYYLFIDEKNNLGCTRYSGIKADRKLCNQINTYGHL